MEKSIDIGANRGIYTYFMRHYSASCDAFEPNPELCAAIRTAFGDGVVVHGEALSNRRGMAQLMVPLLEGKEIDTSAAIDKTCAELRTSCEWLQDARVIQVPVHTLDDFRFTGVGCIKIDVEGHELSVLEGGHDLLERDAPNLILEIEERHRTNAMPTIRQHLESLGYEGFYLLAGRLWPIATFSPEEHQDLGRRPYINNFVFLHRSIPRPWFALFS
jgi:FkbM family methyltransferase